jgi:hypothetical protein
MSELKKESEIMETLRQLDINQWEKEGNSKEWNTRAKENSEKNAARAIHKSIFGS